MIDFTLYPNLNGNLGENKVAIPDGITTQWPDGDALVGNFIYKDGKLVGFVDTKALIANESKSTTIPYDFVESEFENVREDSVKFNLGERCKYFTLKLNPKYKGCKTLEDIKAIDANYIENDIVDGVWSKDLDDLEKGSSTNESGMFTDCENLTSFKTDLKSLKNGPSMFRGCFNLTTFESDLSSLTNGLNMFANCENLSSFKIDLKSLTYGRAMFANCSNLTSFTSNLGSIGGGLNMFANCSSLTTFSVDLKSLIEGWNMFSNCSNLSSFVSDLSSLTRGRYMFNGCSNLTDFTSDLKSLIDAQYMFNRCKLNTQSLKNIAETINTVTESNSIHIGIGNKTPSEEENTYLTQIYDKGWQVYVNGSSNAHVPTDGTSLIPIDGEQNINPIPFWAKPILSDEESANYVDERGDYYNILGGQFIYVNDPEEYGMFISEEDAAAQMRLIKIEKEEN